MDNQYKTVLELLSDKNRWTQDVIAKKSNGEQCPFHDAEAASWCLTGAIFKVYPDGLDRVIAFEKIIKSIIKINGTMKFNPAYFNDTTTYEVVMRVVREANV